MTTGLLLEDTSAPGAADDDSGQLGQLRKKLNLLQGTQACFPSSDHHEAWKPARPLLGLRWCTLAAGTPDLLDAALILILSCGCSHA